MTRMRQRIREPRRFVTSSTMTVTGASMKIPLTVYSSMLMRTVMDMAALITP